MAWGIAGARDISLGIFPEVLMTPCPSFFSGHSHGELEEKPEEEGERLPALGHGPHQLSTKISVVSARLDPPGSFMPDLFNKQDFLTSSG